jgi:hypothetical protein
MDSADLQLGNYKPKGLRIFGIGRKSRVRCVDMLTEEEKEIIKAAIESREEWIENSKKLDYVVDEKLVDYYIYRLKASEARYSYFLNIVKEKGLSNHI